MFTQKYLKAIYLDNKSLPIDTRYSISNIFQSNTNFSKTYYILLTKYSNYNNNIRKLKKLINKSILTTNLIDTITYVNKNKDKVTINYSNISNSILIYLQITYTLIKDKPQTLISINIDNLVQYQRQNNLLGIFIILTILKEEYKVALIMLHIEYYSIP